MTSPTIQPKFALASVDEMNSPAFRSFAGLIQTFVGLRLRSFDRGPSKRWEYPWLWHNGLSRIDMNGTHVVDLGSELSPMPWFLASLGATVTLIETAREWVSTWERLRAALKVDVTWQLAGDEEIPLPDASADVVTSFSVIEHQPNKTKAIDEVARVLRPFGLFALSFDVCEPAMGMTFPSSFGQALSCAQFETDVWYHPAFAHPEVEPSWNVADVPAYLAWHRTTNKAHNYVTGAAVMRKDPGA